MPPESGALPPDAWRLRVTPPDPYVYRSRAKRAAAAVLDAVGDLALARRPAPAVDWAKVRRVAVLRLDHLGDLVLALPALRRLRRALPHAALDLWVGPWGRELADLFVDIDAVRVCPAPWFERPRRRAWPWGRILSFGGQLRGGRYDAAFELRGDLRHHLALWRSGIAVRAGQALTAGRFLLSHPARWVPGLHEADQSLSLMDQVGLPAAEQGSAAYLKLPSAARREAAALSRSLKLGHSPILVQAGGGAQARLWTPEAWALVLQGLPAKVPVALLGSPEELADMRAIAARVKRPVALATGRLSLSTLAAFLERARLVLAVNTGPAHLAALQGTPVLVVFSAANAVGRWAPRGVHVKVLSADGFPCSPCERTVCPYDQACMRALGPDRVLAEAKRMLGAAGRQAKGKS